MSSTTYQKIMLHSRIPSSSNPLCNSLEWLRCIQKKIDARWVV